MKSGPMKINEMNARMKNPVVTAKNQTVPLGAWSTSKSRVS